MTANARRPDNPTATGFTRKCVTYPKTKRAAPLLTLFIQHGSGTRSTRTHGKEVNPAGRTIQGENKQTKTHKREALLLAFIVVPEHLELATDTQAREPHLPCDRQTGMMCARELLPPRVRPAKRESPRCCWVVFLVSRFFSWQFLNYLKNSFAFYTEAHCCQSRKTGQSITL